MMVFEDELSAYNFSIYIYIGYKDKVKKMLAFRLIVVVFVK